MSLPDIQSVAADVETGACAAAIRLLEQLIDRFPTYSAAHLLLARAYRKQGNRDAALRALAQVRLWSSAPMAVRGELRALIHDHLDTVYSASESPDSPDPVTASPAAADRPADLPTDGRTSRSTDPDDLVEDLEERLGPPEVESDEDIKDLNSLIDRLEGARIQPEPDFGGADPLDDIQEEEAEEEVVSETLARIYAAQKEYRAAVETYQRLAEQHPDRAQEFHRKAREMEDKLS